MNLNVKPGEGSLLPVQGQDPDTSPRLPPTNKFPGHILAAASNTPASLWYCCWEVSKCAPRATQSAWLAVQFRGPGKYWMQLGWPSTPAPRATGIQVRNVEGGLGGRAASGFWGPAAGLGGCDRNHYLNDIPRPPQAILCSTLCVTEVVPACGTQRRSRGLGCRQRRWGG